MGSIISNCECQFPPAGYSSPRVAVTIMKRHFKEESSRKISKAERLIESFKNSPTGERRRVSSLIESDGETPWVFTDHE
jgi:hypothetical protein